MFARLLERETYRVDAARLAAADADRRQVLRDDDRIRAHVLAHPPSEDEVSPARLVRLPAGDLHRLAIVDVPVSVLHEQAAEHTLEVALATREAATLAVAQDANRFLPLQRLVVGREQHVDEPFRERFAQLGGDGPVDHADHPKGGNRIGCERALVRLFDRARDGNAARIRMLDDHAPWQGELAQQQARRREVEQVDQRQLLPVQMLHT